MGGHHKKVMHVPAEITVSKKVANQGLISVVEQIIAVMYEAENTYHEIIVIEKDQDQSFRITGGFGYLGRKTNGPISLKICRKGKENKNLLFQQFIYVA